MNSLVTHPSDNGSHPAVDQSPFRRQRCSPIQQCFQDQCSQPKANHYLGSTNSAAKVSRDHPDTLCNPKGHLTCACITFLDSDNLAINVTNSHKCDNTAWQNFTSLPSLLDSRIMPALQEEEWQQHATAGNEYVLETNLRCYASAP